VVLGLLGELGVERLDLAESGFKHR
jgi:hypothetical protein